MRLTKRFMVGAFLAAGAGLLVATIPYQAGLVRAEAAEPFAIEVPVGRFGDVIHYAGTWSEGGGHGETAWAGDGRFTRQSTLEGPVRTMDRTGAEIDAVRWVMGQLSYPSGPEEPTSNTTAFYVDLKSREPIRTNFNQEWEGLVRGHSHFGPGFGSVFGNQFDPRFQGQTLHLGANLSYSHAGDGRYEGYTERVIQGQIWEDVPARATVNGTAAILRQERWAERGVYEPSQVMAEWTGSHSLYFSADSPYPLLADFREDAIFIAPDGTKDTYHWREVAWLEDYVPGSRLIPWGQDNNATAPFAPERVHGSDRPLAEGANAKLEFPLADAIATLATDPQAPRFQEWAASRDERLVGAIYWEVPVFAKPLNGPVTFWTNVPMRETWYLYFADDTGSVVGTWIDQRGPVRTVWVDATPIKLPPAASLSFADLPEDPVTIGGARSMLDTLLPSEERGLPTAHVIWGLARVLPYPYGNLTGPPPSLTASYDGSSASYLEFLTVAVREQPLFDSDAISEVELPQTHAGVSLNTESGELRSAWSDEQFPALNLPRVAAGEAPETRRVDAPSGVPLADLYPMAALGASTFLAVFLAAYFYPLLKFMGTNALVAFPGYAKLQRSELLTHSLRDAIVQHVRADPGITPPQLQASTGAAWSTVVYHLSVLEKNRILSSLIDGRHKRFFPVEATDWSKRHRVAVLKNDRTKQAYSIILEEPGVVRGDLANRLGVSVPAIAWHIERLERVGLVAHDADGRKFRYYALDGRETPGLYDAERGVEVA